MASQLPLLGMRVWRARGGGAGGGGGRGLALFVVSMFVTDIPVLHE